MVVLVSTCCNDIPWYDTDLCASCKEHADFLEHDTDQFEGENNDDGDN